MRPLVAFPVVALVLCASSAGAQSIPMVRIPRAAVDSALGGPRRISKIERVRARPSTRAPDRQEVASDTEPLVVRPGEVLVQRADDTHPTLDSASAIHHFDLSARALAPTTTGALARISIAILAQRPLRYDGKTGQFAGLIDVGLDDSLSTVSRKLATPVHIYLDSDADKTAPKELSIDHTKWPYQSVLLQTAANTDSVTLHIVSDLDQRPTTFRIAVTREAVAVNASPPSIYALGLERTRIGLRVPQAYRKRVGAVSIRTLRGSADATSHTVDASGMAEVSLRSAGIGVDTVVVEADLLRPTMATVDYRFPFGFLIAVLLGGLVGGSLRPLEEGNTQLQHVVKRLGVGALSGLVVTVAWAVGINLLQITPDVAFGLGASFVVAALGAHYGLPRGLPGMPQEATSTKTRETSVPAAASAARTEKQVPVETARVPADVQTPASAPVKPTADARLK